jgi:glycine C-acetyltransferase
MEAADSFVEYCNFIFESGPFDGHKAILHVIKGRQGTTVEHMERKKQMANFASNNYSGLASDERIVEAAIATLKTHGYGMSSAPLMCGFQDIHKKLEQKLSEFHSQEDTLLYPSGYHTNVGVFAACFNKEDAIFSDAENHASIIDGIRLSKAKKYVYKHLDIDHLESQLKEAQDYRFRCIVTEGVFSMEADILNLPKYIALAKKYNAIIYLDECHSIGVLGKTGRGCIEHWGVDPNDICMLSSTLGKAIGGGGGGYTTGKKPIIEFLRQCSRTFVFSNSLCSPIIGASLRALEIFAEEPEIFTRLQSNGLRFRQGMKRNGFYVYGSDD